MSTKKMQIIGLKGKSAYQYAQDGGYAGTEAEFKNKMANELDAVYDYNNLNEAILATAIKPEVSGEFIHITDSAALPIMDFGMEGKTEQFTTSGKQLWKHGDVTFIQKGTFDVHLEAGKYTFTAEVTSTDTDAETCLVHIGNNIARGYMQRGRRFSITFELAEFIDFVILYASDAMGNGENDTAIFKNVMLNSETTAKPYEPYTGAQPSPNPDYPQEIINAGTYNDATGRYEIGCSVGNKNLFDKNNFNIINCYISDRIIKHKDYTTIWVPCIPNMDYTVSKKIVSKAFKMAFFNNIEDGAITDSQAVNNSGLSLTCNSKNNRYLCVWCYTTGESVTLDEILDGLQIEVGTVATNRIEHASQQFTLTSPVPITKWDKLVKRDGVYGWSILSKEHEITGRETFNSGGDTYYTGSSTNMYLRLDDITSLANLNTQYIYCNELSFIKSIWDKTDGSVGMITNGEQLHLRLPNKLLGVSDDSARNDKIVAHRVYLEQRYDAGNPLKLLYKVDTEQSFHPLPDNEQALLKELETYYNITNIFNDQNCPMSIQYVADTQTYIDNLTTSLTNAVVSLGGEV